MVNPEEWKSLRRVWPNYQAQMGVYFLLIEDQRGCDLHTDLSLPVMARAIW
jgi:hypothetical protein